jgi:Xaa-Pro dipeptidase
MSLSDRAARLQTLLSPTQLLLLSTPTDISYFTQFQFLVPEEREAFVVITHQKVFLLSGSFSPLPTERFFTVLEGCRPASLARHLEKIIAEDQVEEVLIDPTSLFVEELRHISKLSAKVNDFDRAHIWELRLLKDQGELELLQVAGQQIQEILTAIPQHLKPGITEQELASWIDQHIRQLGGTPAFPIIVAFGEHSTQPHYQPNNFPLQENTVVLVDAGINFQSYRSDMTRTWWFGSQPAEEFLEIEKIVQEAYQAAVQTLQQVGSSSVPVTAKDVDQASRSLITQAGYGQYFIHTTGHGVGLDIHEPPSLHLTNSQVLQPGMVVTIEPGIYLPGKYGYRFENTVAVGTGKVTELT